MVLCLHQLIGVFTAAGLFAQFSKFQFCVLDEFACSIALLVLDIPLRVERDS